jgi:hypothetical protein
LVKPGVLNVVKLHGVGDIEPCYDGLVVLPLNVILNVDFRKHIALVPEEIVLVIYEDGNYPSIKVSLGVTHVLNNTEVIIFLDVIAKVVSCGHVEYF